MNEIAKTLLLLTFAAASGCAASSERAEERAVAQAVEAAALPFYGEATFTPQWRASADELPADFHRIPDFSLTNQADETITGATFSGKIYVANFFFTSCSGICGKMNRNMQRVQHAFADDDAVMFVSHSVTPEADTPSVLRGYAERFECIPGKWHLATGAKDHIYALGREGYFVEEDQGRPRKDAFLHSENLILVDADRHIRGIYNGLNRTEVDQLIADIEVLRSSSS